MEGARRISLSVFRYISRLKGRDRSEKFVLLQDYSFRSSNGQYQFSGLAIWIIEIAGNGDKLLYIGVVTYNFIFPNFLTFSIFQLLFSLHFLIY